MCRLHDLNQQLKICMCVTIDISILQNVNSGFRPINPKIISFSLTFCRMSGSSEKWMLTTNIYSSFLFTTSLKPFLLL